jgi:hypothetical protein
MVLDFLASGNYFRDCSPRCNCFYRAGDLLHRISSLGTGWAPQVEEAAAWVQPLCGLSPEKKVWGVIAAGVGIAYPSAENRVPPPPLPIFGIFVLAGNSPQNTDVKELRY